MGSFSFDTLNDCTELGYGPSLIGAEDTTLKPSACSTASQDKLILFTVFPVTFNFKLMSTKESSSKWNLFTAERSDSYSDDLAVT